MRVFNFYQFINELASNEVSLEDYESTLNDIFNDLYEIEYEELHPERRRPTPNVDVRYGYIILRTPTTLQPGQIIEVRPEDRWPKLEFENSENVEWGFSIKIGQSKIIDKVKYRALDLFRRQTGVTLGTTISDEGYLIMADPKTITFIESILEFEDYLTDIALNINPKYYGSISIDASDPLEISINFNEGKLNLNIERGVVLGNSNTTDGRSSATNQNIPVGRDVKYRVSSINGAYEKDSLFEEFYNKVRNLKINFDIDVYSDPSENVKLVYDILEKNIILLYQNEDIELREKVEDELDNLKSYHASLEYEYIYINNIDTIEVDLDWKEGNYQFNIIIDKPIISIEQFGKLLVKVNVEDLSESIYLLLMDGKLKITQ